MKKIICIILSVIMLCGIVPVFAQTDSKEITVTLDGENMEFDVQPIIENGRTLVPMRAIFEALGCAVTYTDQGGIPVVTAKRGDEYMMIIVGENKFYFDNEEKQLDVPAKIVEGRTLVPLRAVSESFGARVEWFGDINSVCIYTKQGMHKIKSAVISKEIKNKVDIKLLDIVCTYPIIENPENLDRIEQINKEYRENAEKYAAETEAAYAEKARLLCEETGMEIYTPMQFLVTYTVDTDRLGLLSLTNHYYEYAGETSPVLRRESMYSTTHCKAAIGTIFFQTWFCERS